MEKAEGVDRGGGATAVGDMIEIEARGFMNARTTTTDVC
jgi:hypothetical protein